MNTGGMQIERTGGASPSLSLPLVRDGKYVFEFEGRLFEVDPNLGGRITRFEYEGTDILAGPDYNETYFGSTFWTSPESDWSQPPPVAHDSGPYDVSPRAGLPIVMTARDDSLFSGKQIKVQKSFDVALERGVILIEYSILNTSKTETFSLAPWEVTRLPGGGLSFFPYVSTSNATEGISVDVIDDVAWFDHPTHAQAGGQKLWADGAEGWLAHIAGDLLYAKIFPPLEGGTAAPGENEVEIYSSDRHGVSTAYIELEVQGAFTRLAPGQRVSLPVTWLLAPLPLGLDKTVGSSELVEWVRAEVNRNR